MRWYKICFALLLTLAGCGGLPRPFAGAPGSLARQLATPPPARLAIPSPNNAWLTESDANSFAAAVTNGLRGMEVPAFATAAQPGDWRIDITAASAGADVILTFTVRDAGGAARGTISAAPVPISTWAAPTPAVIGKVAAGVVPDLGTLLTNIEAARRANDPNSLVNRPARVYVPDVTGAPGDGNVALARQMRRELPRLGMRLLEKPDRPDFTVAGVVKIAPIADGQESVEITWVIKDAAGAEAGKIAQLNAVPRGSLNGLWVDVAVVVAQEAAGGVRDVISNRIGAREIPRKKP